jgi:hypothetical protein
MNSWAKEMVETLRGSGLHGSNITSAYRMGVLHLRYLQDTSAACVLVEAAWGARAALMAQCMHV